MLKQFLFICFISIILSCGRLDTRPKYISATQNISVELSDDKTIDYSNLKTFNFNLNEFKISGRQIPTSNSLHKVDEYQKIKINGDTLTFEVTLKLYVVISSSSYYSRYIMTIGAVGFSKMEIVEATMEPNEAVEVSFSENSITFSLSGVFRNGYIISLRYVYITTNTDLFYKSQYVTVGSKGEYYGICKVTFEAEGDSIILGTKNNLLTFDGSKVDYSQDCPEEEFTDYIIITRYGAKWNSYISQKAYSSSDYSGYAELTFPRMSLGGNNFILENNVDTPYVNYIDENIIKHNGTHYIVSYNYPKKGDLNTNMGISFINSIDNEFVFPMDESFILNTTTEITRAKAKEILESDTSNEPDYIKLRRWVTNNMKNSLSYSGVDMTVDEILSKLIGVCEYFTKLYKVV